LETKRNGATNLRDIVLNYLTDNEKGIQAQQAGIPRHARTSLRVQECAVQLDERSLTRAADTIRQFHRDVLII